MGIASLFQGLNFFSGRPAEPIPPTPRQIVVDSYDALIRETTQSFRNREIAVFCGAGLSFRSGLPLATDFTRYLLQKLAMPDPDVAAIVERLPFEAFVEALRESTDINGLLDAFDGGEPNTGHRFLAKLAKAGVLKTICTTNFDRLIERAFELEGLARGPDYNVFHTDEAISNVDWKDSRVRLVKLHGSADDKAGMAITLRQVASSQLTRHRFGVVRSLFSTGPHTVVLVLGYSSSDEFDISPQIRSLTAEPQKTVLFVQHSAPAGDDAATGLVEDINKKDAKNPFKSFRTGKRALCDTDALISALWTNLLVEPHVSLPPAPSLWRAAADAWLTSSAATAPGTGDMIAARLYMKTSQFSKARESFGAAARNGASDAGRGAGRSCIALSAMAGMYRIIGDLEKALELHLACLSAYEAAGDDTGRGNELSAMGMILFEMGQLDRAIAAYERGLPLLEKSDDKRLYALALGNLGVAYQEHGSLRKARKCHERALALLQDIGDVQAAGGEIGNLGNLYINMQKFDKGISYHQQALEIARSVGDGQGIGRELGSIATGYARSQRYREAISNYTAAIAIARQNDDFDAAGSFLENRGTAYRAIGDFPNAINSYREALAIFSRSPLHPGAQRVREQLLMTPGGMQ